MKTKSMSKVGVFILGAGEGSRIQFGIGKYIPKCIIPISLIDEYCQTDEVIFDRIYKSINAASKSLKDSYEVDIHLMISNTDINVCNYITTRFKDVYLHLVDKNESSIHTFLECSKIIQTIGYDVTIFINGDLLIRDTSYISTAIQSLIKFPDSAIVESHLFAGTYWSSIEYEESSSILTSKITSINPDYCKSKLNLCDVTSFSIKTFNRVLDVIHNGFTHQWWEMSFISMINNGELDLRPTFIANLNSSKPILKNVNNLREGITRNEAFSILKKVIPMKSLWRKANV